MLDEARRRKKRGQEIVVGVVDDRGRGETHAAHQLQTAVESVYTEGKYLTGDVGGTSGTTDFTDAVLRFIKG